jgi:hypothetical protein
MCLTALSNDRPSPLFLPAAASSVQSGYSSIFPALSGRRISKERLPCKMNGTPFVRQYGILNNKWGDLLCPKGFRRRNTQQSSRSWGRAILLFIPIPPPAARIPDSVHQNSDIHRKKIKNNKIAISIVKTYEFMVK